MIGAFKSTPQIARATVTTAARLFLNSLLPPQCLGCHALVDTPGRLCSDCFSHFTFIAPPHCDRCGTPFEGAIIDDLVCGACLKDPPVYERARAAFVYNSASRTLVLKFKHGDRTDAAAHLARWLQRAGSDLIARCDVIVPVPLHRWRFLMRSYNQSALLARALGALAEKPVMVDALARIKATPTQGGLDRISRRRNVAKAFAARRDIAGKRVLLIDDVLTTGATTDACARTLFAADAAAVDVLVLARVPGPGS
jgi:ComF family protein